MSDEKNKANYLYLDNNEAIQKEFKLLFGTEEIKPRSIPFNSLNIIIGANNSRKSRFMRHLLNENSLRLVGQKYASQLYLVLKTIEDVSFEVRQIKIEVSIMINEALNHSLNENLRSSISYIAQNYTHQYLQKDIILNRDYFLDIKKELIQNNTIENYGKLKGKLIDLRHLLVIISEHKAIKKLSAFNYHQTSHYIRYFMNLQDHEFFLINTLRDRIQNFLDIPITFNSSDSLTTTYIPTLRGTTALEGNSRRDLYEKTIRAKYAIDKKIQIVTGLDFYQQVKSARNDVRNVRKKFEAFETFVGDTFFNNSIDIVAKEGQDYLQLYIENEGEREFHHLGSGIQSLIILLYPLFMANDDDCFFIEEPELNMHPGLQSLFMHTILNNEVLKAKNLKIFLTTHSNHLLDTLLFEHEDCSILSFEKKNIADSKKTYTLIRSLLSPSNEALDLLGVSNSSVFMANCAVWIEGVSDRRYLKAFLLAYQRFLQKASFVENVHYAFFEYAGSNISHYDFDGSSSYEDEEQIKAYFLSNKIFLLADRDQGKNSKHDTLTSFNNEYFQYMDTEALEIENILSPSILKKVFKAIFKTQKTDATPEEIDALEMTVDDYYTISMGEYIQSLKITERKIGSKTLTTDYKNKFSNTVLDLVLSKEITWTEIAEHPSAQKITIALYDFLKKHNPLALQ